MSDSFCTLSGLLLRLLLVTTFEQMVFKMISVSRYGNKCEWLTNDKFLKDLEGDSVDAEILDEELRLLHEQQPKTCRGKTAKALETSPLQIAMCVLVLVDAGVVVAEILLDLHAIRSQQRAANDNLYQAMDFLWEQYYDDLSGFENHDVEQILEQLKSKFSVLQNSSKNADLSFKRTKRTAKWKFQNGDATTEMAAVVHDEPSVSEETLLELVNNHDMHSKEYAMNFANTPSKRHVGSYNDRHAGSYNDRHASSRTSRTAQASKKSEISETEAKLLNNGLIVPPSFDENHLNENRKHLNSDRTLKTGNRLHDTHANAGSRSSLTNSLGALIERSAGTDNLYNHARTGRQSAAVATGSDGILYSTSGRGDQRALLAVAGPFVRAEPSSADDENSNKYELDAKPKNSDENIFMQMDSTSEDARPISNLRWRPVTEEERGIRAEPVSATPSKPTLKRRSVVAGERRSELLATAAQIGSDGVGLIDEAGPDKMEEEEDGEVGVGAEVGINMEGTRREYRVTNPYAEYLLKIAHLLHYASIAILGVFVMQVLLRLVGMGVEFFRNKLEVFDGAIILASFTLDLVFIEGITGAQGEEAVALIIIFLLWRILRVINGFMVTAKNRQEFRIKLQKRACRRAEKRLECKDDELSWKEKELCSLKNLCIQKGITEQEMTHCKPTRCPFFTKMDTSTGLSSIASLSLGFTMSVRARGPSSVVRPHVSQQHKIPAAHSLVSLSSHRHQAVQDIYSNSPLSIVRHADAPGTGRHLSAAAGQGRPLLLTATEWTSMERIVEEKSTSGVARFQGALPNALQLPKLQTSTSLQDLVVDGYATSGCLTPETEKRHSLAGSRLDAVRQSKGGAANSVVRATKTVPNCDGSIHIVVSEIAADVNGTVNDVTVSDQVINITNNPSTIAPPADENKSSAVDVTSPSSVLPNNSIDASSPVSETSPSRTVQFQLGTPLNMSQENLDQSASENNTDLGNNGKYNRQLHDEISIALNDECVSTIEDSLSSCAGISGDTANGSRRATWGTTRPQNQNPVSIVRRLFRWMNVTRTTRTSPFHSDKSASREKRRMFTFANFMNSGKDEVTYL